MNEVYSDENIKDYTNENLDSPLAGKEDELRDFLNGIAPNRAGSSDDEQTARDNTKTNAEAFSALYQKSYDEWTLKGYFGTDIDVDAMGEAIRTYIDQVAPNKGDYKGSVEATQEGYNDNSFHDDYKYGFSGDVEESPETFWDENEDYVAQENGDDFVADHEPVKPKAPEETEPSTSAPVRRYLGLNSMWNQTSGAIKWVDR